jgi:dTDP-D-glucose 4,6-dehydratase
MNLLNGERSESNGHAPDPKIQSKTLLADDIKGRSRRVHRGDAGHCYIHGSGRHSRKYLYVTDAADALDAILHRGEIGQVYNIGGGHEMSNLELAQELIHRMVVAPAARKSDGSATQAAVTAMTVQSDHINCMEGPSVPLPQNKGRKFEFTATRQAIAEQHLDLCKTCSDRTLFVEDRAFNDRRYAVDAAKLIGLGWSPKVDFEEGICKTSEFHINEAVVFVDIYNL